MPFKKGRSGNPSGKPSGTKNKIGLPLRENMGEFLSENFELIVRDFKKLKPKERAKLFCDLLPYYIPKLQSIEIRPDIERLPDDQLEYLLKELKNER